MQTDQIIAYDYDAQQWVEGELARQLLIEQMAAEIELLAGDFGPDYFSKFVPQDALVTRQDAIRFLRMRIAELERS